MTDPKELVIRRAGDADGPAIARLRRAWTQEQQAREPRAQEPGPQEHASEREDPGFEQRLAAWYEQESSRRVFWLAEVDGVAAGMMNLTVFERMPRAGRPASHWGYLGNAFVLPEYRNQGIGRRLIRALLDHAAANNFARVVLSPSERSISFYQRAGFGPADELMVRSGSYREHGDEDIARVSTRR